MSLHRPMTRTCSGTKEREPPRHRRQLPRARPQHLQDLAPRHRPTDRRQTCLYVVHRCQGRPTLRNRLGCRCRMLHRISIFGGPYIFEGTCLFLKASSLLLPPRLLNSRAFFSFFPCNHIINKKIIIFFFRRSKRQRNFCLLFFTS